MTLDLGDTPIAPELQDDNIDIMMEKETNITDKVQTMIKPHIEVPPKPEIIKVEIEKSPQVKKEEVAKIENIVETKNDIQTGPKDLPPNPTPLINKVSSPIVAPPAPVVPVAPSDMKLNTVSPFGNKKEEPQGIIPKSEISHLSQTNAEDKKVVGSLVNRNPFGNN